LVLGEGGENLIGRERGEEGKRPGRARKNRETLIWGKKGLLKNPRSQARKRRLCNRKKHWRDAQKHGSEKKIGGKAAE